MAFDRLSALPASLRPIPPALRADQQLNASCPFKGEACVGQIAGTVQAQPCLQCTRGLGPWVECIVVEGEFKGSCCNCHYKIRGKDCSFRAGTSSHVKVNLISKSTLPEAAAPCSEIAPNSCAGAVSGLQRSGELALF